MVAALALPDAVFKTCPWRPRELIETGLRQWLRCCAPALRDRQVIGMPSRAVDEAWHGFILCTARYSAFCDAAYGQFLHHHPDGAAPDGRAAVRDCQTSSYGGRSLRGHWWPAPTSPVFYGISTARWASRSRGVSMRPG